MLNALRFEYFLPEPLKFVIINLIQIHLMKSVIRLNHLYE
jgi:hypothetical protein